MKSYKMKNNIIIVDVPRAGKSTISHRLARQYGYQHISMDSVIAGFEKCFPETGVNAHAGLSSMDTLRLISGKTAPFVRAMLDSGEYDELEPGMVLDFCRRSGLQFILLNDFACCETRLHNAGRFHRMITLGT